MKKDDKQNLHTVDVKELMGKLSESLKEFHSLRVDHIAGKLKNVSSLKMTRKKIAVLKTILRKKQLELQVKESSQLSEGSVK